MIRNLKRVPVLLIMCGFVVSGLAVWASAVFAEDRMAKDGDKVSIHYTGSLDDEDKTVFDTSKDREPLEFTLGDKNLIAGMNNGVRGMKVGESKTIIIPQEEAYTKNLPPGITAGTPLRDPQGNMVMVKEVNAEKSLLDANHILAGKTLIFDIKLVSIK
jgi:peptidylprolyl isomerase